MLISQVLDRALASCPDAVAATLDEDQVTFAELDGRAVAMAKVLLQHLAPGAVVLWCTETSLHSLSGLLACAHAGMLFVPVNPQLSRAELAAVLEVVRPDLLVTDDTGPLRADRLTAAPEPGTLRRWGLADLVNAAATGASMSRRELPEVDPDSGHIGYLTSGSTGVPKAVVVSHRASWLRSSGGGGTFAGALRGRGGIVCTFPLFHYGGWHYVLEAWLAMTAIHLVHRADAQEMLRVCRRRRPSALYAIPAVWERILDQASPEDLASLRHCDTGTSPVAGDLVARIKKLAPGSLTAIHYGSTEAGRMASLPDWELEENPGSVGRPAFPSCVWIAEDTTEVCVSGPGLALGYLHRPELTAAAFSDGCYRSGDLGEFREGVLYLQGRSKEMIRTGGESVAPAEVEQALRSHPGVSDVAVVGLPDPVWHEIVCAVVVPEPGHRVELDSLRAEACGDLVSFKHPRRLVMVDSLPRTVATGQIQRGLLRTQLIEGGEALRQAQGT